LPCVGTPPHSKRRRAFSFKGQRDALIQVLPESGAWTAGDDYVAIPVLANGQIGAPLDLRPWFEKFFAETR
jgi:hypothetical protein